MEDRFKTGEKLMAATRAKIPEVAVRWLAAARDPLEKLTMAALSGDITDDQFQAMVKEFSESLPGLLEKMDHAALAELMEEGMGAAMANGFASRNLKSQISNPKEEKKAKLPWETDVWLAGKGRGKKCGNSWISRDKECRMKVDGPAWEGSRESMAARAMDAMKALPRMEHPVSGTAFIMNGEARKKTILQAKSPEHFMAAADMGNIFLSSTPGNPIPDKKGRGRIAAFHEYKPNPDPNNGPGHHFKLFRIRSKEKGT